ncbi:LysR family transcriptional regulator [Pseudomonas viridiflava]|uniref:LysR family transcriptional regulator n=1 Tax=Pseudomonas viridiflava TaxID=33069 RepID=UPI0020C0205B|nr:LysR family transcriptional regulator [Pseudomonas viridiflava]
MENLGGISIFVLVAETRSFTEAGRRIGISSSGIGKSVARLEERLGTRLFHRSTRSINLTAEGALFLERCRRILGELETAESELSHLKDKPQGKLRISLPLVSGLVMPALIEFMKCYPDIELDVDFSDRMVDVVEEGFDAVLRTGTPSDSRLMSKKLGSFQLCIVGAPGYFESRGTPRKPSDLRHHACLLHKFPSTGRFEMWPLKHEVDVPDFDLPQTMVCNTTEVMVDVARSGLGIACLPDFMVNTYIRSGELELILEEYVVHSGMFRVLWPSSKHMSRKLRVFIDFMQERLFPEQAGRV